MDYKWKRGGRIQHADSDLLWHKLLCKAGIIKYKQSNARKRRDMDGTGIYILLSAFSHIDISTKAHSEAA